MNLTPVENSTIRVNEKIAIVLSAGYFGFFAHAGFMLAVEELGIHYQCIAGSSAGAIVAALHAAGLPAKDIGALLCEVDRKDFWDSTGVSAILKALLRKGRGWTGLLKGDLFERMIGHALPVKHFEDCPRSLYITAFNLSKGSDETFYSGSIADKVRASCSYPFLMMPKAIDGSKYWDGGFLAKVPMETMIHRERPDRVLIHYLPTRDSADFEASNWSAVTMLESALSAARKEIESHRLCAVERQKAELSWIVPEVPSVGPNDLASGKRALDAAYSQAIKRLPELITSSKLGD
jgi:NTE family protein